MNTREVHGVRAATVTVEEGVALGQLFVEHYLRVLETHFFQQLFCGFDSLIPGRYGQRETQLSFPVVHRVPVRFYFFQIQRLVEIIFSVEYNPPLIMN